MAFAQKTNLYNSYGGNRYLYIEPSHRLNSYRTADYSERSMSDFRSMKDVNSCKFYSHEESV